MEMMGVKGDVPDVGKFLARVSALEKSHGITIQLLRADRVFGAEHLVSATEKALRAMESGTAMARTLGMEILLYAAAERQTSEALRKLGIYDGIGEMAAVVVGHADEKKILAELGLERDDALLDPEGKDYSIFCITGAEMEIYEITELVLEKVALSEIER